ncbi:MAG: 3-deoxy-manno-octulosonate cytidylyltransferase [Xanthobacteraceae bacterium]|jgi:3-deoxy-manno-octulosonate cytidylyltransferase (CMP-KDO synthetase)|nr:3-deoxy-manno-octulosonate cytidylyltransferase [Xanthobacteraceae bacterium]
MAAKGASRTDLIVLIPARMQATRLPGKPLADIHGRPMILHVLDRANEAGIGEVAVATDDGTIRKAVEDAGGHVLMTSADHQTGSDRIFEALGKADPAGRVSIVVNLQGDLPAIEPGLIRRVVEPLSDPAVDIATLAVEITDEEEKTNPNVVKVVGTPAGDNHLRALYFTRATAPANAGPLYHHIGIYAYRRAALERFVKLPRATLEQRERLEQLRALEAGMRIDVAIVDAVPLGVDTPADLEKARALLAGKMRKS